MADGTIDITNFVRAVERIGDRIEYRVDQLDTRVGLVQKDVSNTAKELADLRSEFLEFVGHAQRVANVQRSETKLGTLKDDLDREYGHYAIVRRTSIGTLQAFDIGNVSNKTVQQVSEELMIQTPRYWLAPALVALAAWSRDDQKLAEKSIDAAFSRDSVKTSLMFSLVLRRQGRLDSATRWLRHYFTSLDPRALTRDFAVVLEAAAQDAFGPAGRDLVLEHLHSWTQLLRDNDPETVEAQVDKWYSELSVHRGVVDDDVYPTLVKVSPQWPTVKESLEHASASGNVTTKYTAILGSSTALSVTLEDRMDDLLEVLVTEYDAEELPLRREVLFHEAVIESNGDIERAQEASDAMVEALDETLDTLSLVTHAGLHPQQLGISASTQKLAIGANKEDFTTAIGRYATDYRAGHISAVDIVLGSTHTGFASAYAFGTWKANTTTPDADAEATLSTQWDDTLRQYVEQHRLKTSVFVIAGLIVAGITLILALFGNPIVPIVGFVVAGGIAALIVWQRKKKADAALASAERDREVAKAASIEVFRDACAEFVDAELAYKDEDVKEKPLLDLIAGWPSFELGKKKEKA
jgi:hypothetical protein